MTVPLFSIVMPAYGHEGFVAEAVRSVLGQTCTDLELIVIDDASPDGTWEVVNGFEDPRIVRRRHETNQGAPATLNEAIGMSRGRYVCIINSDDVYHPRRLEAVLGVLEQGAELVGTDIELIDEHSQVIRDKSHWWIEWVDAMKETFAATGDLVTTLLTGNCFLTTSNFCVNRRLLERIGRFNNYRYVHDYEFILRVLADTPEGVRYLADQALLSYRLHGSNTIREDALQANRETFTVLARWLPSFVRGVDRGRIGGLGRHLQKIEGYIEMEIKRASAQELQALREEARARRQLAERRIQDLQSQLTADRERLRNRDVQLERRDAEIARLGADRAGALATVSRLEATVSRLEAALAEKERVISSLYASYSLRVGMAVLYPANVMRRWLTRRASP